MLGKVAIECLGHDQKITWILRFILFNVVLWNSTSVCFSQTDQHDEWKNLLNQYQSGKIDDTLYLNKVRKLVGQSLKDTSLREKLNTYKKIAWSKDSYQPYRVKYYAIMANNATFTHKEGAAIYYIQKSEEELKKIRPYINSLNEPRLLLALYGRNFEIYGINKDNNPEKQKAIFAQVLPFLKTLPETILNKNVPSATCTNAMNILSLTARFYADLKDTAMVNEIENITERIWNSLQQKNNFDKGIMQQCLLIRYKVRYWAALMIKDFGKAKELLNSSRTALAGFNPENQALRKLAYKELLKRFVSFYMERQQSDSARHYLQLLKEEYNNNNDPSDGTTNLLYSSRLNAMDHHYEAAYKELQTAYNINDSLINLKTADINRNMYAQLMAEQKNEEVVALNAQKQKRTMLLAIVSFFVAILIAFLIIQLRRREKRAKEKIEELNKITQMQITELEIKANLIQRKLGMELHDDIAGRLVHMCNFIDKEMLYEPKGKNRERLELIGTLAKDVYKSTRYKSHEWYSEGLKEEEDSFSESVHKLTEYALPDERYEKEIEIDNLSLQKVSHIIKIQLLRIIQEAMSNILKHANANKVKLFIYEEDNMIVLQIKDNGKGFDTEQISKKHGMGLHSLQSRVAEMGGSVEITSSKNGTELIVTVPILLTASAHL